MRSALSLVPVVAVVSVAAAGTPAGLAGASPCGPADVAAFFGYGAVSGQILGGVSVRNIGEASCRLPLRPTVRLAWRGWTLRVREGPLRDQQANVRQRPVSVLRPGQWAFTPVWWSNWCGARPWHGLGFRPQVTVALVGGNVLAAARHPSLLIPARCVDSSRPSTLQVGRFLTPLPEGWTP